MLENVNNVNIVHMKRAFIIHGWGGHPEERWYPWAKNELEKKRENRRNHRRRNK